MNGRLSPYQPQALALLRIVSALLFIEHGTQKLLGFPVPFPMDLNPLLTVAGVLEIVGGLMLLVGFMTRPVAFILSGMMAVAYFMAHVTMGGFWPVVNMGEAAILYCFIFLYIATAGAGAWSVDASRGTTGLRSA